MVLMDVPPPRRPTLNVVRGDPGTWKSAMRANARPRAWIGLTTPNDPKLWPPGPLKVTRKRALPMAMCDTLKPLTVDRHEAIDPALQRLVEEALDAAQIAKAFFADRSDEGHRAGSRDTRLVHRPGHGQHVGEPAAIVADAGAAKHVPLASNFDVGAARKHRIEVRAHDDVGPGVGARPLADDVALGVGAHVPEADVAEHRGVQLRALGFLKRRGLDFADPDLIVDGPHLIRFRELDCRADRRRLKKNGTQLGRALLRCGDGGISCEPQDRSYVD